MGTTSALKNPAASRYGATTPALLKWFKKYNAGKPRDQQVWPFNFMFAYQVSGHRHAMGSVNDIELTKLSGKRTNSASLPKPVAPYDADTKRAAKTCFDRENGEPVNVNLPMTYQEALAQYHLHPESKLLNGDALSRGRTQRRRIEVIAINCVGKEANRRDEQYYLGLSPDAQIDYELSINDVAKLQRALKESGLSQRDIAKRIGISRPTLAKLLRGEAVRDADEIIGRMLKAIREITKEQQWGMQLERRCSPFDSHTLRTRNFCSWFAFPKFGLLPDQERKSPSRRAASRRDPKAKSQLRNLRITFTAAHDQRVRGQYWDKCQLRQCRLRDRPSGLGSRKQKSRLGAVCLAAANGWHRLEPTSGFLFAPQFGLSRAASRRAGPLPLSGARATAAGDRHYLLPHLDGGLFAFALACHDTFLREACLL